jgi:RHH-type transcriptional regulator, rel operon repressor / antitoxin RelB
MTGRRRSFMQSEVTRRDDALNDWQIEEIKKGIVEAERGDFANDEDVKRTIEKWTETRG